MNTNNKSKVIGQESLVNELRKVLNIFISSNCEIKPNFILTGKSGNSKSFTIKTIAEECKIGFLEINAAQLTKEGTSGNSLSKALSPLIQMSGKPCIVFVDEFDKLFISGNSNDSSAHEATTGVQNEFLKVLESDTTSVFGDYGKYINAPTKNVLYIFAGAFNGEKNITLDRLREIGLKTEFLGRVGLVYETKDLTLEDLYEIVDTSDLLTKYTMLFNNIDREIVVYNIKAHLKNNYDMNTIGARLINTLIHQYFIKGGKLSNEEANIVSFQKKLEL